MAALPSVTDLTLSMLLLFFLPVKPVTVSRKSDSLQCQKGKNLYFKLYRIKALVTIFQSVVHLYFFHLSFSFIADYRETSGSMFTLTVNVSTHFIPWSGREVYKIERGRARILG